MMEFNIDNSIRTIVALVCAAVLASVICRVAMMNPRHHKHVWFCMLTSMGAFTVGTAIDVLSGGPLTWHEAAGLIGISQYLWISYETWKYHPPERARKDSAMSMTPTQVNEEILTPALALLPANMDSERARCMLLTIGLQESKFKYRRQMNNGPAMGFWQFERGGGVNGVLTHPASRQHVLAVCGQRGIPANAQSIWAALETDDILAAFLARLLLWTDPKALPAPDDVDGSWEMYLRVWRPGKPHVKTWAAYRQQAAEALGRS